MTTAWSGPEPDTTADTRTWPRSSQRVLRTRRLQHVRAGHRAARGRAARGRGLGRCGSLLRFGQLTGSADYLEQGHLANRTSPNWTRTTASATASIWSSSTRPTTSSWHGHRARPAFLALDRPAPGAHVARAAGNYLHTQVEAGHGCPITMTFAAVPALRLQPDLAALWEPKITAACTTRATCPWSRSRRDHRHGHDREAGRLRRARQHHARLPRGPGRPRPGL
jgi:hypothetical protein